MKRNIAVVGCGYWGKYLESKVIQTTVYYPLSIHLQEVYKALGYKAGDFSESELTQAEVLSLPIYPEPKFEDIKLTAQSIADFLHNELK